MCEDAEKKLRQKIKKSGLKPDSTLPIFGRPGVKKARQILEEKLAEEEQKKAKPGQ